MTDTEENQVVALLLEIRDRVRQIEENTAAVAEYAPHHKTVMKLARQARREDAKRA